MNFPSRRYVFKKGMNRLFLSYIGHLSNIFKYVTNDFTIQ